MSLTTVHRNLIESPHRKNVFINGNMEIYQRRSDYSGQTGTSSYMIADRWLVATSFDGSLTSGKSTDVPPGEGFISSHAFYITTPDTSLSASQFIALFYYIEGYDFNYVKNKRCTLSFWAKTTKPGTYTAAFRSGDWTYTYKMPFVLQASVWTKVELPVTFNSPGGVFDAGNGIGAIFEIIFASGTDYIGGNTYVWETGGKPAMTGQVNFADAINDFYLTGLQLEVGDSATDFEFMSKTEHIALCQRYYEKSYYLDTTPGTYPFHNGMSWRYHVLTNGTTSYAGQSVRFCTEKRASPTVTVYCPETGAAGTYRNFALGATYSATAVPINSGFYWYTQNAYSAIYVRSCGVQWVANAEIGGY